MKNILAKRNFTRITALLLVVAVIFGTMFSLPVSAASGDKVTITFDYCYDSTGNTIKFQQTTVSDGYTVGTVGEELCKIFADGKEAYCIEPGHTLYSGNTLTEDGSTVWKNLGSAKQKAINLALLYGKPGSGKSLSGTEDQKWVATQLIVWEFVSGCRSTGEGYKCTNTKFIDGICAGGANPGVKSVYNAVSKSLANYSIVPSFASAIASKAETYEMKYSDGKYTLTLTDSNSILSDFSFKTTGGVSASVSGNKLTLTSSNPVNDAVTFNSAKSMPNVGKTVLVPYGDATLQDVITGVENDADPIRAYFKVKTSSGNLKLVKTSEDGDVANIEFTVNGDGYSKTVKTNSKGEFKLTDLVPGNYIVTEVTDSKYETQKSQTVKVESGKTATVTFENVLKKGSLEVVKTSEDNFNEGVEFHLYGTSLSGASIDLYATTNADGVAKFENVLVSGDKPYTLEEVNTADRYVVPKTQRVVIEWNKVTKKEVENKIIRGSIKGLKIDNETKENIEGALFGLFGINETEFTEETAILTAESNEKGIFTFENLPYGEYIVRELKPAEGYLPNEKNYQATVSEDEEVIEITVENDKIPELGTTATIDGKKEVGATEVFTLEDVVEYKHLVPGKEYTVKGMLMDKTTGEPLLIDEKEIRSEITFTPDEPTGEVIVSFEFDTRYIKKDTDIVVFESLYSEDKELAVHAEIDDEGQTVTVKIPKIGTKASVDGKKEFTANGDITIDDVVSYKNFTAGKEYTIKGVLMDKSTGKQFLVDGKEVCSEVTFTPETADGEVTVSFTFDGSVITKETEIVVFETLYREGTEIAVHANIEDENQTVTIHPQPEPEKPQTGDNSNLGFYIGLGSVAVGGLIAFLIIKFKRKDEDDE
ncbi:VaFE repeat-containing surface-anchored protein [Ruminococcus sp.]|uniref:VaFE repeat-containing surface-anchored protein n=1 Tax=Ruminococcus sp. TaxID=41978 RepID=UPI0035210A86